MNPDSLNDSASLISWQKEFQLCEGIVYLNHAAVAPWPRRTVDAVKAFADANLSSGATAYADWLSVETRLRDQLKTLIHAASADDIALLKNTSEGLSFVANGLIWQDGDNIVTSDQEFPSNRVVWQALAAKGVDLRQVDLGPFDDMSPEAALIQACDGRTRLLAISSVQYASGLRLDLETLGAFCRSQGIVFCVDAIQSVGALDFDVQRCHIDIAAADAHKWLLGPEGIALFYVAPPLRDRLALSEYGWHMVERQNDFDATEWEPASSARRYECGSPNMLGIHAFSASLSLLLDIGIDAVERRVLRNSQVLTEAVLDTGNLHLRSPLSVERRSGIVSFRPRQKPVAEVFQTLRRAGIVCAVRGGAIRFSPHFYNTANELSAAVETAVR